MKSFDIANKLGLALIILVPFFGCKNEGSETAPPADQRPDINVNAKFTLLRPEQTGVRYTNRLKENITYNIFTYEYIYNGAGVAIGDVNGDKLPDLYFSTPFGPNRLYLNKGNMIFQDVTKEAGVPAIEGFKTGVTMADVNGDGRLDIYSCRTSKTDDGLKTNLLFINKGNKTVGNLQIPFFEEQAKQLGLNDNSDSNHASFFDYDRDGDLDCFILNHRIGFQDAAKLKLNRKPDGTMERITTPETPFESNKFYRNDNGRFVDVTAKAGLVNSAFGLSATPVDINKDGWMDIYIANDFIEPDNIYLNNKNGTFTDAAEQYFRHGCQNCMGSDIGDINNDGLDDIMILDMKSEDPARYKELSTVMMYDRYNLLVDNGYGRQVGRNILQLNMGNNTFVDIAQYAGVAATDWSWTPLMADFNNDGWKDFYITNGYRRDVTDMDYTNYFRDSIRRTGGITPERYPNIYDLLQHIPEKAMNNYLLINTGQLSFVNATAAAGMDIPSFSNGAAYADLDLDGDLDIVVHNIDDPVMIYRNDIQQMNWLQVECKPTSDNKIVIGTSVEVVAGGMHQHLSLLPSHGFLSCPELILHFGLDQAKIIDSIILTWPDGDSELMTAVQPNQRMEWKKGDGKAFARSPVMKSEPLFLPASDRINWKHNENPFVDFKREKLIPYMLSAEGPCLSTGDINGDQLEDIYAGNGAGFTKGCLIQQPNGSFASRSCAAFEADAHYEDCGSALEDFDGDGDLDLIVISGGNAEPENSTEYQTRYYLNDGKGEMTRMMEFPDLRINAGALHAFDYDQDGDEDILIGAKSVPGRFPIAPDSYLLRNDKGRFTDVTKDVFPALKGFGMISDIASADMNKDGKTDIVIVGEWIPVSVFTYNGKRFENNTEAYGLEKTSGWWKSVTLEDIDGDGDVDILAGNMGLNHRLKASINEPLTLITKDFDGNGSLDPIMCFHYKQNLYPYPLRDNIIAQLPVLKKKFLRYKTYASATINDVFTPDELKDATRHYVHTFETRYFKNEQQKFVQAPLPYQVQLSPVYDVIVEDFNGDGRKDLLMAGNFLYAEIETAEMDAGCGTLLFQQADGTFTYSHNRDHNFWANKEVRELRKITLADGKTAVVTGNNRGPLELSVLNR